MKKAVTICIANQKGGVGKTTTAVTIAHGLARQGRKTLLVDLDSQGNVADSLGLEPGNDLYKLLTPDNGLPISQAVTKARENLDVIRADKSTVRLKLTLAGLDERHLVLSDALAAAAYDAILIDCPPSVDLFQTAALVAADYLIIPTQLSQLAIKGIKELLDSLKAVRRLAPTECQLVGIIPTLFNRSTTEQHEQLVHLAKLFKKLVYPPVPVDTKCNEATRAGQTLWEYAPQSRALQGFINGGGKSVGGYGQVMSRVEQLL